MLGDTSDDLTYNLILMHNNMSHAMERRSRPHWKLAAYGASTVMDSFIAVSDSASSGDDERMQRRRRYAIRTVMSAVTEAGISDGTSYTPRRGGSVPGRAPNRDRALLQGAIDLDKDYFNRLNLVIVPRLEPDFERRYRMPRSLYEKVRAGVLEVDAYFSQRSDAAGVIGASTDQKITAAMRQLAFGCPADAAAELVRVSESLASKSLLRYCRAVRKSLNRSICDALTRTN
jgi:hypothetical protein